MLTFVHAYEDYVILFFYCYIIFSTQNFLTQYDGLSQQQLGFL